ncbi:MAG: formylglycine-generating enzyme family protein, partial [bacterium]|nr:formylglycine-generating enzyme family protein [bacterium]
QAQKLLARVLSMNADFREAARYMYLAVTGIDPDARIKELEQRIRQLEKPPLELDLDDSEELLDPPAEDDAFQDFPLPLETFDFETITVNERGEEIERKQCQARQFVEDLGNGITLEMVTIPEGTFWMGQTESEKERLIELGGEENYKKHFSRELPRHQVTVEPFCMGRYPLTQEQWEAVFDKNPSNFKGAKRPVEKISWKDTVGFCEKLSEQSGRLYRLPSEAEWEYACRAGTETPFYFGDTLTGDLANYNATSVYASEKKGTSRKETSEVGIFPPNDFGLYDMPGNVWEWCADPWHENYEKAPGDGSVWEEDGDSSLRQMRGGSWFNSPRNLRCALRNRFNPGFRFNDIGFRVVFSSSRTF